MRRGVRAVPRARGPSGAYNNGETGLRVERVPTQGPPMSGERPVYIGTDGGATTSKVGGVWDDGTPVSTRLLQRPTNVREGPDAVVRGWVEGDHRLPGAERPERGTRCAASAWRSPARSSATACWTARPTCRRRFTGFDVHTAYSNALAERAGRAVPLIVGNDGNFGGVAEAQQVRGSGTGTRADARPRLRPGLRLHRPRRPAAGRRHPGGHGGRPHAGAAAPAGRPGLPVRLRPDLGLRRGLHHPVRPAAPAGRQRCRSTPTTSWPARRCPRRSRRWPCAAWPRRATRWPSKSSTSRPGRWGCTSPTWRWPSTRSSSSSAAA